jgi:hypothetical protein
MQNPKTDTSKLLYTRRESAYLLSISTVSLDRLIKRGELRPTKVGGRVMIAPAELTRFATGAAQ